MLKNHSGLEISLMLQMAIYIIFLILPKSCFIGLYTYLFLEQPTNFELIYRVIVQIKPFLLFYLMNTLFTHIFIAKNLHFFVILIKSVNYIFYIILLSNNIRFIPIDNTNLTALYGIFQIFQFIFYVILIKYKPILPLVHTNFPPPFLISQSSPSHSSSPPVLV